MRFSGVGLRRRSASISLRSRFGGNIAGKVAPHEDTHATRSFSGHDETPAPHRGQSGEDALGQPDSWLEQLVPLYGAMLRRRLEADLPVKGRELLALAQLEWRLENQRQVKRLNDLTRGLA